MLANRGWKKQIWNVIVGTILVLMLISQPAFAIDPLNVGTDVTLDVHYRGDSGIPVSNAEFRLYKVGEIDRFGKVKPTGIFAEYPVSYEPEDTLEWKRLAGTLAVYIEKDGVSPVDQGMTNGKGMISFPNNALEMTTGLYLLTGREHVQKHLVYTPEATLICLPSRDENDNWNYNVTINPKYEFVLERTEIQVIKRWNDNDNKLGMRPKEIEIQLLKDGKVYDTVILNKANNWRHTWTKLEASSKWAVLEADVMNGYIVDIEKDDQTFLLTNTFNSSGSGPENELVPEPEERLPNTGVLWWPVPVLAGTGMTVFVVGWIKRRKSEN